MMIIIISSPISARAIIVSSARRRCNDGRPLDVSQSSPPPPALRQQPPPPPPLQPAASCGASQTRLCKSASLTQNLPSIVYLLAGDLLELARDSNRTSASLRPAPNWRAGPQPPPPPSRSHGASSPRRRPSTIVTLAEAIRVSRLEAPKSVQAGQQIKLRCLIEATRGDRLQSLAWYKNGREFYRFQPFERRQPVLAFNLTGVNVDSMRSKNTTVYLVNTNETTSGRYRCEATGTSFQEASMETSIEVTQPGKLGTFS